MLVISIRGPPNSDFVLGYPGIDASWPRIVGIVEVRSNNGRPFKLRSLDLQLYRTETIYVQTGKLGISQTKRQESYPVGKKVELFKPGQIQSSSATFLSLELRFVYTLPFGENQLSSSICIPKVAESIYRLYATAVEDSGSKDDQRAYAPVTIVRYDTMSSFLEFQRAKTLQVESIDSIVVQRVTLQRTSFGPGDSIVMVVSILPNLDWKYKSKKVKVQSITLKVEEVIVFSLRGDDPASRSRTLLGEKIAVNGEKLGEDGYSVEITTSFPVSTSRGKDGVVITEENGYPNILTPAFTSSASLYSITYFIVVGSKLSNCKDIEMRIPITVTPFDSVICDAILEPLNESIKVASTADDRQPNPIFVTASDAMAVNKMGILVKPNGKRGIYIE
ncbi:hypothetical protein V1514DRAFT_324469 [Lipomyces japonicus]|uniref:uncharacterized protein n=1 Tax=Lipomyces japonicus TaxID=56871 RepID=UPI0034CE9F4E